MRPVGARAPMRRKMLSLAAFSSVTTSALSCASASRLRSMSMPRSGSNSEAL
jgi:hypothetical protein